MIKEIYYVEGLLRPSEEKDLVARVNCSKETFDELAGTLKREVEHGDVIYDACKDAIYVEMIVKVDVIVDGQCTVDSEPIDIEL